MRPIRLAMALALALPGAAPAGSCGYETCWGAVAAGPGGAWGYAYGQASQEIARAEAQGGCRSGCIEVHTFYNACGAIAVGTNGATGWATDSSREGAERAALSHCASVGNGCSLRAWACSY